eukprot:8714412-Karenia_brevis.AAC.1
MRILRATIVDLYPGAKDQLTFTHPSMHQKEAQGFICFDHVEFIGISAPSRDLPPQLTFDPNGPSALPLDEKLVKETFMGKWREGRKQVDTSKWRP